MAQTVAPLLAETAINKKEINKLKLPVIQNREEEEGAESRKEEGEGVQNDQYVVGSREEGRDGSEAGEGGVERGMEEEGDDRKQREEEAGTEEGMEGGEGGERGEGDSERGTEEGGEERGQRVGRDGDREGGHSSKEDGGESILKIQIPFIIITSTANLH